MAARLSVDFDVGILLGVGLGGREAGSKVTLSVLLMLAVLGGCGRADDGSTGREKVLLTEGEVRPFALVGGALAFREVARRDLDAAAKEFKAEGAFAPLLGRKAFGIEPAIWPLFFSGSSILAGCGASEAPITGFYNPMIDAGILVRWRDPEGEGQIERIWVVDGRQFGEGEGERVADALPRWMRWAADLSMPDALGRETDAFVAEFEKRFPPMATNVAEVQMRASQEEMMDAVEARLMYAVTCLRAVHDPKAGNLGGWVRALRDRLREGDETGVRKLLPSAGSAIAGTLISLPESVRREVLPVFAHINGREILVHLVPPAHPDIGIACVFQPSGEGVRSPLAASRVALLRVRESGGSEAR